jgi:parvulin-like peptidyl-prolyl isomerase
MPRSIASRSLLPLAWVPLVLAACGGSKEAEKPAAPAASASTSTVPAPPRSAPSAAAPAPSAGSAPQLSPKIQSAAVPDRDAMSKVPVARVNGQPVPTGKVYSMYQMNKSMIQQRGRQLSETDDQALKVESLELVLADELLYQEAVAKNVKAPAGEVDAAVNQFKSRVGTEDAYKQWLAKSGITEVEVRDELERNIRTEAYRRSLIAGRGVSEEQAKKYYEANAPRGIFNVPERVHIQSILLKSTASDPEPARAEAKKRAEEAAKRASAGEDFAALAKEYSQDASATRGGDLGLVPRGVMFPKLEEIAFSAKPGSVSPVFETPKGFNVIRVLERQPESTRSYDEVKQTLITEMGRYLEQEIVQSKVKELAAAAKIEVLDPSFAPPQQAQAQAPAAKPPTP